jgi:hypothetical protein
MHIRVLRHFVLQKYITLRITMMPSPAAVILFCGCVVTTLVKGLRTALGDYGVGLSDILSLTKIDILFHLPPSPLHADISTSPSLEVSLSSACIIRLQALRVNAGVRLRECLFKRTTNILVQTHSWASEGGGECPGSLKYGFRRCSDNVIRRVCRNVHIGQNKLYVG